MNYFELKELILSRQSCRDFSNEPLDKETMEKIVDLARFSPSACNSQPWKMYCAIKQEDLDKIAPCLQDDGVNAFTSKAKGFICITEQDAVLREGVNYSPNHFVKYDIGELIAYITLTAKSLGVESCIIGCVNSEKLKNVLNYSDKEQCLIVIALGYSDIKIRSKVRKDKEKVVSIL